MGLLELLLAQITAAPLFYSIAVIIASAAAFALKRSRRSSTGVHPFERDCRQRRRGPITDKTVTDKVLKQGFVKKKIPENLDAIVIGSGIGGLTTAAILAKTNKKVLVLEQHDQAGGCCHTFTEKGYEFDVGIHYIGNIHVEDSLTRVILDQISNGQIDWAPMDENYDTIVFDNEKQFQKVELRADKLKEVLLEAFPEEEVAINTFLEAMGEGDKARMGSTLLKLMPAWLATILYKTGILDTYYPYSKYATVTTEDYLKKLTDNERLRAVLGYTYMDFGTSPASNSLFTTLMLMNHYGHGAAFPVGGASQIALNIIPVIEAAGGRVLVRARVTNILTENGRAIGVRVSKGQSQEPIDIYAKTIISGAGVYTTKELLPKEVFNRSTISTLVSDKKLRPGYAALGIFVGLDGSADELGLKAQNVWSFTEPDLSKAFTMMTEGSYDPDADIPMLFISFNSAKDPDWTKRNPTMSTVTVLTFVSYDWFKDYDSEQVKHRSDSYEELKDAIGKKMWSQVLRLYPQFEDRVEYFDVGSPVTNNYYIGSTRGEIYGLDHNISRFHPETSIKLRPDIGIPGLYITGQDVVMCGLTGSMMGGLTCAGAVLKRNLHADCLNMFEKFSKAGTVLEMQR